MKVKIFILLLLACSIIEGCGIFSSRNKKELSYFERITLERTRDPAMEEFIDSLVDRMSLIAKIGQMTLVNESFFIPPQGTGHASGTKDVQIDTARASSVIKNFQIGCFFSGGKQSADDWRKIISDLQELNLKYSENKIPILFGIDDVHGANYIAEGTIFPHEINLAATFDTTNAYQTGVCTAEESEGTGLVWNFAPILDLGVNKLWPRLYETYGEDTYLASEMGAAYIRGLQGTRINNVSIAATAKHFIGYSYTESGWDRTPARISPQELQEFQVPVFKSAIDAGVMAVMINSGEINGTPVHASYYYLTNVLRDQLGFQGVAVSDYGDIIKLNTEHFVAVNEKESTYKAIIAGVDLSMTPATTDFCRYLKELVEEGRISKDRIDLSVRRILRLKYRLRLFRNPFPAGSSLTPADQAAIRDKARKAAGESIVLIRNEFHFLPLFKPGKLVVAGMNADSKMALCGGWSYSWQGDDERLYPDSVKTVFNALRNEFETTQVVLADASSLKYQASDATAIIVVTGEKPYAEGWGNIDDLALDPKERDLLQAAVETGKPVILILLEGRPRIIGELFDKCRSVLFAGLPGMYGAEAISGILSGRLNPSGKMPLTYPYHSGHIIPYNYKAMEFSSLNVYRKDVQRYSIAEFGTGLAYSNFEYAHLNLSDTVLYRGQVIHASVQVTNRGPREGHEAVLWFISARTGTYTRPVRQLKYFEKKFILPGEIKEYRFTIDPDQCLAYPDENGNRLLETGDYSLQAGPLKVRFHYAGEKP